MPTYTDYRATTAASWIDHVQYVEPGFNRGITLDFSMYEEKIRKIISKAIGETLRELKMNISEEEFLSVLKEKIDA